MKFNPKETIQLTEVYRRLGYFQKWNLNEHLLMLAFPSEVKTLKQKDILEPSHKESKRSLCWYRLTEEGKKLFQQYSNLPKLSEQENLALFEGRKTMTF